MEAWEIVVWIDLVIGFVVAVLCVVEAVYKREFEGESNEAAVLILIVPLWGLFLAGLGIEKLWMRYCQDRWERYWRGKRRAD